MDKTIQDICVKWQSSEELRSNVQKGRKKIFEVVKMRVFHEGCFIAANVAKN